MGPSSIDPVGRISGAAAHAAVGVALVICCTVTCLALGLEGLRSVHAGWAAAGLVAGTLAHEVTHGLGWILAGVPADRVRFGILWRQGMSVARCAGSVSIEAYRLGVGLPVVVAGLLPWTVGLAAGSATLALVGGLLTASGAADLLIVRRTLGVPGGTPVTDLEHDVGFGVPATGKVSA